VLSNSTILPDKLEQLYHSVTDMISHHIILVTLYLF